MWYQVWGPIAFSSSSQQMSDPYLAEAEGVLPTVAAVTPTNAQRVLHTLTLAFADDPASRWLYPEEVQYLRHFPTFAMAFGGAAIDRGTALATRDYSAVALWLSPQAGPNEEALAELIKQSIPLSRIAGVLALVAEMGRVHPREPHWYLPLIGVEPARRGMGLGAALLRPVLEECDAAHLHANLEATSSRSVPLY